MYSTTSPVGKKDQVPGMYPRRKVLVVWMFALQNELRHHKTHISQRFFAACHRVLSRNAFEKHFIHIHTHTNSCENLLPGATTTTKQDPAQWSLFRVSYLHSSWSLAVTVSTVCWMSSFSSTSASYRALSKYGGLSFLSAMPIRMNLVTVWEERGKRKL